MFFLIQLVRQFNDLLCFRFLLYLKKLPFDMLQAGDSFNSRIGVTFQFSIRTVCATLYCPLIFGKKVKKHLPATGAILVEVQYQFLLDRDGRPDIPLPYPFASTVLLFHKDFVVTFITTKIRVFKHGHSQRPVKVFQHFGRSAQQVMRGGLFKLKSAFTEEADNPLHTHRVDIAQLA